MKAGFVRDGIELSYRDEGEGPPLVFQHGLGGAAAQALEITEALDGFRTITLECRGHGASALGPVEKLSIAAFADDLLALMDHLGIARAHVGGISMGAAITTALAARHPTRVLSLCIARPAWFDHKAPANMAIFTLLAQLLDAHGVEEGRVRFVASKAFADLKAASPDNAVSLLGQFDRPDPVSTQALLSRIAVDGPGLGLADYQAMKMPVEVIGQALDAVHPLAMARAVAAAIPGARMDEITPKTVSQDAYRRDFLAAYRGFLASLDEPEQTRHV